MKYLIPITVTMLGEIEVEADDFERAKLEALKQGGDNLDVLDVNEVSVPDHVTEEMCRV